MHLSGTWQCHACLEFNDYEGDIESECFNNIESRCHVCGEKVILSGYVDLVIDAEPVKMLKAKILYFKNSK